MVTVRDVAQSVGLSTATVSRALSKPESVAPETRARVLQAARDLGYRGNALARGLRTQRTDSIGILVPDIRNPFFTELAYHAEKEAAERGLAVLMGSADERVDQQDRYLEVLQRHMVDGMVVVPQGEPSPTLRDASRAIPTVFVDRDPGIPGVPTVMSDNRGGLWALVDHVVGLGHRRVAVIAGPQSTSTGRQRLSALKQRLSEHGRTLADDDVREGNFQLASGIRATEELLDHDDYDLIIAADNLMALGALMVLRERRVEVGSQIGLACVDDLEWFSLVDPPITVIAQDPAALARAAIGSVVAQIAGGTARPTTVPMTLIPRASCGELGHTSQWGKPRSAAHKGFPDVRQDTKKP